MEDLKERTIRGGFAKICTQAVNVLLHVGSLMVLARLLEPKDFVACKPAPSTALLWGKSLAHTGGLSTRVLLWSNT